MTPSPHELGIIAGNKVRVKPCFLSKGSNPREVFIVTKAPSPSEKGEVILKGNLSNQEITTYSRADSLTEKVD